MRTARTLRVIAAPPGVELYFPPGRMPEVALPLATAGAFAARAEIRSDEPPHDAFSLRKSGRVFTR